MKKIIIGFISIFLLAGCSLGMSNTPSKAVEAYLDKYINNDDVIIKELDEFTSEQTDLTNEQKATYKEVLKKQYSDLTYEIEDEEFSADTAVVTVKVSVYDLYKAQQDADAYLTEHNDEFLDDQGNYDSNSFLSYRLNKMKEMKDKVDYTIKVNVSKVDKSWSVDQLSNEDLQKIHGVYNYETDNLQ